MTLFIFLPALLYFSLLVYGIKYDLEKLVGEAVAECLNGLGLAVLDALNLQATAHLLEVISAQRRSAMLRKHIKCSNMKSILLIPR